MASRIRFCVNAGHECRNAYAVNGGIKLIAFLVLVLPYR